MPDRLTSKAARGSSAVKTWCWATSKVAWDCRAQNGDRQAPAFCEDVVLGDFRGRLGTAAFGVGFKTLGSPSLRGCCAESPAAWARSHSVQSALGVAANGGD